ncbi:Arf-GAP with dual PH domain-containing protein 1, partial [Chelonia mydas]
PDWASHTLGVFICLNCSGIHRNIPHVSKVKSVRLDSWDDAQVEFMATNGNNVAKARYESKIPPFYYKPTFPDCHEGMCFKLVYVNLNPYLSTYIRSLTFRSTKRVQLLLKLADSTEVNVGALNFPPQDCYENSGSEPNMKEKNSFTLRSKSLILQQCSASNHLNQLASYRNLQCELMAGTAAEPAEESGMIPTFKKFLICALHKATVLTLNVRHCKSNSFPSGKQSRCRADSLPNSSPDKKARDASRKQCFIDRSVTKAISSPVTDSGGEVFIGSKENSYKVLEGLPPSTQGNHWQYGITIVTPDRKFLFACETESDQQEWITAFQKVISRPMLPQEYADLNFPNILESLDLVLSQG